jgi:exopolysaccharide biosynthesis polyprenyl glycosylphosphotransferase
MDFMVMDLIWVELCFFIACVTRHDAFAGAIGRYLCMSLILLVVFAFHVAFLTMYSGILRRGKREELRDVFSLSVYLFVALTLYCFITKTSADYSRGILLTFFVLCVPVLFVTRTLHKAILRQGRTKNAGEVLLFIHEGDVERKIDQFTAKASSGIIVTGIITWEESELKAVHGIPIVGNRDMLRDYVEKHNVWCVYLHLNDVSVHEYIEFLVRRNVLVYRSLRNLEKSSFRYSVTEMNGYKTLCVRDREVSIGFAISKRMLDVVVALVALITFSPVMLATAIAIKLEDGGSVIYSSKRVGKGGKEFDIYKFRSMRINADRLEDVLSQEELACYYKEFKLDNDPRVTKVGQFIRKYSIDELPQFINILKGDMALIGPRPLVKQEVEINYPENQDLLLSIKPGLTGYWQAYARNNVGYENGERQKMELYYILHSCWNLDVKIIFRTAKVVLTGDGAK